MSWTTAVIDNLAKTYRYAQGQFGSSKSISTLIGAELGPLSTETDIWKSWDVERQQMAATKVSWIYSNIIRIANEITAADFNVYKSETEEKDIEHPLEKILRNPNPFFSGIDLLQYTVWGLSLDEYGAFWLLVPDEDTGELLEIWPVPIGRIEPVPHKNKFISHYLYYPKKNSSKPIPIRKDRICRFLYANPRSWYKSLTPLEASTLSMSVYEGIATSQKDLFIKGRGVPLSILSLDPNISERDFAVARQRIREDWEEERKVAIVRGGSLDVRTVGLTSSQLQIIDGIEATRDEIDSIFMGGLLWRRDGVDEGEINKQIKEVVIYPLHRLIAARIQLHIVWPYYGEDYYGKFDDIRAQDRGLSLQENTIYFRSRTFNETRVLLGIPPFENEILPGYGELPYVLATNAAFITRLYDFGMQKDYGKKPEEVGNVEETLDPENLTNRLSGNRMVDLKSAVVEGMAEELKRYKKVLLRTYRKSEDPQDLIDRTFDTDIIYPEIITDIRNKLATVKSESDIQNIFDYWLE